MSGGKLLAVSQRRCRCRGVGTETLLSDLNSFCVSRVLPSGCYYLSVIRGAFWLLLNTPERFKLVFALTLLSFRLESFKPSRTAFLALHSQIRADRRNPFIGIHRGAYVHSLTPHSPNVVRGGGVKEEYQWIWGRSFIMHKPRRRKSNQYVSCRCPWENKRCKEEIQQLNIRHTTVKAQIETLRWRRHRDIGQDCHEGWGNCKW